MNKIHSTFQYNRAKNRFFGLLLILAILIDIILFIIL